MVQEEAAADWLCLAGFVWLDTYRQTLDASSSGADEHAATLTVWGIPQDDALVQPNVLLNGLSTLEASG